MNNKNIFIKDDSRLQQMLDRVRSQGPDNIHFLVDFDRTITQTIVNGKPVRSSISIIRDNGYLGEEYSSKAQALFDKYHPLEKDKTKDSKTKAKFMLKRRSEHFKVLQAYGLSTDAINFVANHETMVVRPKSDELFKILEIHNIPTVVLSASGLGVDVISQTLRRFNINLDHIHIVSNELIRDDNGLMTGVKEPIIHSFNKSEVVLNKIPDIYAKVEKRKNVILIGDSLQDIDMLEGFDADCCIKIGFCNPGSDVKDFLRKYDVVISEDGDMGQVIKILNYVIGLAQEI